MSGLLTGSSRRALRSPRGAGGVLLVTLLVLSAGCEGATEPVADSLPDLLVHESFSRKGRALPRGALLPARRPQPYIRPC
jgi:hypothetical protein